MTFVITLGCCNDSSCVPVCPVQCIRPRPGDPDFTTSEQLYIDPATCIDCGACMDECPVDAIHSEWDLPESLSDYLGINADYFATRPITESLPPDEVRRQLPADRPALSVAVVGSGPAACYAVDELSSIKGVSVSVFERLPTPYGLVRAGVAPDHPNTKRITDRFAAVLGRPNVTCWFNVEVGRDVSLDELLGAHHAVLWAGGADDDRRLGIPGEDLPGSYAAREFVAWYNGHPDHAGRSFDLQGRRAVVIGNGNVALDVARVLAQPVGALGKTDIADHAITALGDSAITDVVVAARRGPEHAAYTTGELGALDRTPGITVLAVEADLAQMPGRADRRGGIMADAAARDLVPDTRSVTFRYGLRPVSLNGTDAVESVTFERPDGTTETIEAGLVLRAVGYRGRAVVGLPFDDLTGTLPHEQGRVYDPESALPVPGVYCSGWIKRGPSGVIGSNRTDSAETVDVLLSDFAAGRLVEPVHGREQIAELVGSRVPDHVDKKAWGRIDQAERRGGKDAGRPRRKFVSRTELLATAHPST